MENESSDILQEGIAVSNAGLVLLNNYISTLFDRLGMIENGIFKSSQDQLDAVHCLQYIATGLTDIEEPLMALNKVFCGISPSAPTTGNSVIPETSKQLMDGMIQAVIGHWSNIADTSINGFRGNWLVRDGILNEREEYWELLVEKRGYDILIHQSPFSFSIIKFEWTEKPIHVNWSY